MDYMHVLSGMKDAGLFFTHWECREGFNISVTIPSVIRVLALHLPCRVGNSDKGYILLNEVYSLGPKFLY